MFRIGPPLPDEALGIAMVPGASSFRPLPRWGDSGGVAQASEGVRASPEGASPGAKVASAPPRGAGHPAAGGCPGAYQLSEFF